MFEQATGCVEVAHFVTVSGHIIHPYCSNPYFPSDWCTIIKDPKGHDYRLFPLTESLVSRRATVRRVMGRYTRFPPMSRGTLVRWTPPPPIWSLRSSTKTDSPPHPSLRT